MKLSSWNTHFFLFFYSLNFFFFIYIYKTLTHTGMRDVIPVDWLRMFSERELQWLISGSDAPLDVMDLRAHCIYTGGYSSLSSSIRRFWNVVNKFTFIEKRQLLRFVTSCERAPSLGFQALHPSFQIMWVTGAPNKRMLFVSFCVSLP